MLKADLCQRESVLRNCKIGDTKLKKTRENQGQKPKNRGRVFLCAQIMSFMTKDRFLEDRVGEIRVKGDLCQALHSENIFFLSS